MGYAHMDIKIENFLIKDNYVKIIDFNSCESIKENSLLENRTHK